MKFFKRLLATTLAIATIVTSTCIGASATMVQTDRESSDDSLGVLTIESQITAYTDNVRATLWGILYNHTGTDRGGRIVYQVMPQELNYAVATEYTLDGTAPSANMPPFQHIINKSISYTLYRVRTYGFLFNTSTSANGVLSSQYHTHTVNRG